MLCAVPPWSNDVRLRYAQGKRKVLKDPSAQWKPLEKFRSFERIDQIWVFIGLGILIVTLNIVFGFGGDSNSVG